MSIQIDTTSDYIRRRLGISSEVFFEKYAEKSVTEIVETEAQQGNQAAIALANELLTNVNLVMELFALANPENRIEIMKEMDEDQLFKFLPEMDTEDLVFGMNFFTQEKLLDMLEDVKAEELVNLVLELFPAEEILHLIPEAELDRVLTDSKMDKNKLLEHLQSIPVEFLSQMIESVTGEELENANPQDMIGMLKDFSPLEFKDSLVNMQAIAKEQLVTQLAKENPEYLHVVEPRAFTNAMGTYREKEDIIKAMPVLEDDTLIKMTQELPQDLLALVISQLDPEKFAQTLMNENPEIIAQIIVG